MIYKAKDHLARWYSLIELQPDAEILKAREKAIKKIIKSDDKKFWLDIIRLSLGVTVKNTSNREEKFVLEFKSADPNFQIENNDNVVKVLASISLCFKLEEDSTINYFIALALNNSRFLNQYDYEKTIPFYDYGIKYLSSSQNDIRNFDSDSLQVFIEKHKPINPTEVLELSKIVEIINEQRENIGHIIDLLNNSNSVLREESNVSWWLLGEYSKTLNRPLKEIGVLNSIAAVAKDLYDLTEFEHGFQSAEQLLHKALSIANNGKSSFDKTSLYDFINSFDDDTIKKWINEENEFSEFTPCLSAFKLRLGFDKGDDWSSAYSKQNWNGNIKQSFLPVQISLEIYNELMLQCNG